MKPQKKPVPITFTIKFPDEPKKSLVLSGDEINKFIKDDKRKYDVVNPKGEVCFRKTYKG